MFSNPFRISANIFTECDTTPRFSLSRAIDYRSRVYNPALIDYIDAVKQQRLLTTLTEDKRAKDNYNGKPTTTSSIDIQPSIY